MFARERYAEQYDSRGGNGCLLHGGGCRRLDYVRRRVADRAVGMCQSIRVKVRLLNGDAYEKKQGAHDDRQEMPA